MCWLSRGFPAASVCRESHGLHASLSAWQQWQQPRLAFLVLHVYLCVCCLVWGKDEVRSTFSEILESTTTLPSAHLPPLRPDGMRQSSWAAEWLLGSPYKKRRLTAGVGAPCSSADWPEFGREFQVKHDREGLWLPARNRICLSLSAIRDAPRTTAPATGGLSLDMAS